MEMERLSLQRIRVDNLFGGTNFEVGLSTDHPTVFTGGNGTGKSTLLRLVHAVSTANPQILSTAPLNKMFLTFSDQSVFSLCRNSDEVGASISWRGDSAELRPSKHVDELPLWVQDLLAEEGYDVASVMSRLEPGMQIAGVEFEERREARDAIGRIEEIGTVLEIPDLLTKVSEMFPVVFIEDQRLVSLRTVENSRFSRAPRLGLRNSAVEMASRNIARRIREADSSYARASQEQDRRFPEELIRALRNNSSTNELELESLVDRVAIRRESLKQVGLLDTSSDLGPEMSADVIGDFQVRPVMEAFLTSTLGKFSVLDELELRLTSFKEFLDSRFKSKKLILSRYKGIQFSLPDGSMINARQLSSGEQQMTVLAYDILFRSEVGTLIIIDEPEISLHVLWQDSLVEDLTKMGQTSALQFLMATHSPALLAEHPEVEFSLDREME